MVMRKLLAADRRRSVTRQALWCGVVLLALIGVGAAVGRAVFLTDFGIRAEPVRQQILDALHRVDPFTQHRLEEMARFDRQFAGHPVLTLLHVLAGGLFLILAPFQLSSRMRRRYLTVHRWSGRLLIPIAFVAGLSGLAFGLLMPFGGFGEASAVAVFGGLFLLSLAQAYLAIRKRQMARHREWMIRAFAIALGISTARVFGAALDIALTPAGVSPVDVFVLALWTGWGATLGVAELWIRHTRSRTLRVPARTTRLGGSQDVETKRGAR